MFARGRSSLFEQSIVFQKLKVGVWNQFKEVDIDFHERLTILTGSNGAGKTSLLKLLRTYLYERPSVFLATAVGSDFHIDISGQTVGEVIGSGGRSEQIVVTGTGPGPALYSAGPGHHHNTKFSFPGVMIPSHTPLWKYQELRSLPLPHKFPIQVAFNSHYQALRPDEHGEVVITDLPPEEPPIMIGSERKRPNTCIKESLIQMSMTAQTNWFSERDEVLKVLQELEVRLAQVFPSEIGFQRLIVEPPNVVIQTRNTRIPFDSLSGGLASIFDLVWQVHLREFVYREREENVIVLVDEPEAHLHPSLQRILVSNLVETFPSVQFIVATHSPFIVNSVEDAKVYVLMHAEDGVVGYEADLRSRESQMILREALGVEVLMPPWAEMKVEKVSKTFADPDSTESELQAAIEELEDAGLGYLLPNLLRKRQASD